MKAFDEKPTVAEVVSSGIAQRVAASANHYNLHSPPRKLQQLLDRSTVHILPRWLGFAVCLALYGLRVYIIQGWFIVTYGLGIFLLNNFIGFLSPQIDPDGDGPLLPTSTGDNFKPFSRRVPEFKFWYTSIKGVCTAFFMTFFSIFDVPVFWHSAVSLTKSPVTPPTE
mmetsp:Transcript_21583/g.56357  ORF Transcript_21583/g.56357 Transcript_21583/m.56357 type:complete len:168 (+) Transcript_21583:69-572(+)